MKELPRISESEWEVMKVVWKQSPIAAYEVIEELSTLSMWKPATIKSLISRLLKKGAIGFHQEGITYFYFPLVSEEDCLRAESSSFLQRIYGGALKPMLVHFLKDEKLSQDEIDELKNMLDGQKGK